MRMTVVQAVQRDNREALALQSALKPRAFAQTKLPQALGARGIILNKDGSSEEWIAEGTFCNTSVTGEHMAVFGPAFAGITLLSAINGDRETGWACLHQAVLALRSAVQSGAVSHDALKGIVQAGPEALVCGSDGRVLVLPPDLYIRTLASYGIKTEIENRLMWVHPDSAVMDPSRALAFTAGAAAYRIIAGTPPFPYAAFDATGSWLAGLIRTELFEPLDLACWQARSDAALLISNLLRTSIAASSDTLLAFGPEFATVLDPSRKDVPETEEFLARRTAAAKKRNESQKKREFLRKYRDAFKIGGVVALFVVILVGTYMQDLKSKPTTLGMEPGEVVEQFYRAIGTLDQEIPRAYSMKGVKTDYDDFTVNLYVTTRVRESYERNGGVLTPAELFLRKETGGRTIFGITGLEIAEISAEQNKRSYGVSLYLWMPSTETGQSSEDASVPTSETGYDPLTIYRYTDTVTLSYERDRWLVSDFLPGMRSVLDITGPQILESVADGSALDQNWAPSPDELKETAERLGL